MTRRDDDYLMALDQLDRMKAAGQVSDNEYELKRRRLLAEASATPKPLAVRFLIGFAVLVVGFICLIIVVRILVSLGLA